jgi:hypothetical protein
MRCTDERTVDIHLFLLPNLADETRCYKRDTIYREGFFCVAMLFFHTVDTRAFLSKG